MEGCVGILRRAMNEGFKWDSNEIATGFPSVRKQLVPLNFLDERNSAKDSRALCESRHSVDASPQGHVCCVRSRGRVFTLRSLSDSNR